MATTTTTTTTTIIFIPIKQDFQEQKIYSISYPINFQFFITIYSRLMIQIIPLLLRNLMNQQRYVYLYDVRFFITSKESLCMAGLGCFLVW